VGDFTAYPDSLCPFNEEREIEKKLTESGQQRKKKKRKKEKEDEEELQQGENKWLK